MSGSWLGWLLSVEWPIEDIPDVDGLYMRVHPMYFFPDGELNPGVFRPRSGPMSTNWARYSTPEDTRQGAKQKTPPSDYSVLSLPVGPVRHEAGQAVEHSPQFDNRSHTDVIGTRDNEARLKLLRMAGIALRASPT